MQFRHLHILLFLTIFLKALSSQAASGFGENPFDGNLDIKPTDVIIWQEVGAEAEGAKVTVGLRLTTKQNFSLYVDKVKFTPPAGFELSSLKAPATSKIVDPIGGEEVSVYTAGDFILTFEGLEPFKEDFFHLDITFLGCTERICLFPYTQTFSIKTVFTKTQSKNESATKVAATAASSQATISLPSSDADLEQAFAAKVGSGQLPFGLLVLVLFLGGLATNLTPCVFPMIPITLRILGSQGTSPWKSSAMYSLGIVATYSALGYGAALSGGLFGSFMASSTVNLIFAFIFLLLGVSMLGFGNFSKLQALGSKMGSGSSSLRNTLLMGAGAGLVAAPCTGPVLGGLLAYTAKSEDPKQAGLLFLIYSIGFALPYVFLGSAAGKISRLRAPASIQVAVKLLFAAAMFGLSFYYLRIPAHEYLALMKGMWLQSAALLLLIGTIWSVIYLRKSPSHKLASIPPAMIVGISLFAGSQWLTGGDIQAKIKLNWHSSVESGIAVATKENKPILVDGWAEWCEACKKMDVTTFQDEELLRTLKKEWVVVKLDFTDMTEQMEDLSVKYGMQGLPVTLLLPPTGDLKKARKLTGYVGAKQLKLEIKQFQGS